MLILSYVVMIVYFGNGKVTNIQQDVATVKIGDNICHLVNRNYTIGTLIKFADSGRCQIAHKYNYPSLAGVSAMVFGLLMWIIAFYYEVAGMDRVN